MISKSEEEIIENIRRDLDFPGGMEFLRMYFELADSFKRED